MTTATDITEITVEDLNDLFDEDQECDILETDNGQACQNPAEHRVGYHCGNCGHEALVFLCGFHLEELRAGNVLCAECHKVPERFVII